MELNYIPKGHSKVIPYLVVENVEKEIEFSNRVFNSVVVEIIKDKEGLINHAEIKIDDCLIMFGRSTNESLPKPGMLYVYVRDTDETFKKAIEAGASSIMEPADMYYGDRNAGLLGPSGVNWWIATHFEDVPEEELQRRAMN